MTQNPLKGFNHPMVKVKEVNDETFKAATVSFNHPMVKVKDSTIPTECHTCRFGFNHPMVKVKD